MTRSAGTIVRVSALLPFRVVESRDRDGVLRMALVGAFDLAVADRLSSRLNQLAADRTRVRIDLGRVQFIDSSGIRALVMAVRNGRQDGVALVEINPEMTRAVRKAIDLVGVAPILWPANG